MTQPKLPNPLKTKLLDPIPSQPNPIQPMGQPNPWTTQTYGHSTPSTLFGEVVLCMQPQYDFPRNPLRMQANEDIENETVKMSIVDGWRNMVDHAMEHIGGVLISLSVAVEPEGG